MSKYKYKNGNIKRQSRFICLKCLQENMIGNGIQRFHQQRERNHVKDLYCLSAGCRDVTKNLEIRYCDDFDTVMEEAKSLHKKYYGSNDSARKVG